MTRLVIIIPSLGLGGAERSLAKLSDVLASNGYEITILCMGSANPEMQCEFHPAIQVVCLRARSSASPWMLWQVWRHLRRLRPQAVAGWSLYANFAAVITARLAGIDRVLVSERNYLPQMLGVGGNSSVRRWALSLLVRCLYGRASIVTANSKLSLRFLRHFVRGAQHYAVLPNLADIVRYARLATAPLPQGLPADAPFPRLLAVGRLHRQKGFDLLIQALALLPRETTPTLYLAGDGPEEPALRALAARLGLQAHVHFLGEVTNPFPLYAWADIVVAPSRFEGFPNVPLEAMCTGAAVIVADCKSGPRELTEGGRFARLVPVEDVEALAKTMVDLFSDRPTAHALGDQARQHVKAHYDRSAVDLVYLAVFARLCHR